MAWAFDLFFFVGFSGPRAWIRQSSRFFYALKFGFYHFPNNGWIAQIRSHEFISFPAFLFRCFFPNPLNGFFQPYVGWQRS